MVESIGGGTPPNVQQQQPLDGQVKVEDGVKDVRTSKGVAGEDGLTIEKNAGNPLAVNIAGSNHDIDEPPAPGTDPNMATPMESMDDRSWDSTCDIFALIHKALAEAADKQNKMEVESNTIETENLQEYMKSQDDLASDTSKLAAHQGWAQIAAGATGIVMGGVAAGVGKGNAAMGQAVGGLGSSMSSLGTAIETEVDAGLQGQLKLDEKEGTVAQSAMQKSGDLRQKHGSTFDKTMSAEADSKRNQGDLYNNQMAALKA